MMLGQGGETTIAAVRSLAWAAGTPIRMLLIGLIRAYRLALSGMFGGNCRFYPSCSHYAEDAVRNAGAVRGAALSAWRLLRCSPLSPGGVDHPPLPRRPRYDAIIREEEPKASLFAPGSARGGRT
jgi:uncharacterized protein